MREVAHHVQHVPAADRVARNQRDDRLRHRADVALQLEHVQARHPALAHVPRVTADLLVAAGAERPLPVLRRAVAGEQHDADVGILAGIAKGFLHLQQRVGAKRVADLGPVEGDARDAVALVVGDVLVRFDFLPVGLAHLGLVVIGYGGSADARRGYPSASRTLRATDVDDRRPTRMVHDAVGPHAQNGASRRATIARSTAASTDVRTATSAVLDAVRGRGVVRVDAVRGREVGA